MDCTKCGAPLPPKSNICAYCGTLNDSDLRTLGRQVGLRAESRRTCPRCKAMMVSLDLRIDGAFIVERCEHCLGIFFDPGEMNALLEKSTGVVYEIDHTRMQTLIAEETPDRREHTAYVACPVCERLMNRKGFGPRSGVVADECRDHGLWLDGGEVARLIKWTRAGGKLHAEKRREEEERRKARSDKLSPATRRYTSYSDDDDPTPFAGDVVFDVLRVVAHLWH